MVLTVKVLIGPKEVHFYRHQMDEYAGEKTSEIQGNMAETRDFRCAD
jgi:hypothetical protein